ncbi:MAG: carboxypeptidase regulatory-like domain-containing protein [Omnitrophica bacterium]|nr:carboxypeptidase regulatory-like domain-containing protein [Candidatus Omnitrophota bacterium]
MKRLLKSCILVALLTLCSGVTFAGNIKGKIATRGVKSPEGVVVYIEKAKGSFKLPQKNPRIDQVNLVFVPRVLPVLVGTTVGFYNSDTVLHNVFGVGDDEFDMGTWKGDKIDTHTFNTVGEVAILCNVHPEMEAYVVVFENPYFGLTDKEGNYVIKNVPPGNYKLKTWHDILRSQTQDIHVSQETTSADFKLKR